MNIFFIVIAVLHGLLHFHDNDLHACSATPAAIQYYFLFCNDNNQYHQSAVVCILKHLTHLCK